MSAEYKLYVFNWYDSSSDNGSNDEYYITNDPQGYADKIGFNATYAEFEQEGFKLSVKKRRKK